MIFSNNSIYLESKICSASCELISYFVCNSEMESSHDLGIFSLAFSNSFFDMMIGGVTSEPICSAKRWLCLMVLAGS